MDPAIPIATRSRDHEEYDVYTHDGRTDRFAGGPATGRCHHSPRSRRRAQSIGRHSPSGLPCHVNDPNLWFAESPVALEHAKTLCGPCPVRAECLSDALGRREPCGVWGGEILRAGRILPSKRPRGRPRKHQHAPLDSGSLRTPV